MTPSPRRSAWPPLLLAIALEVSATLSLRAAEGFTHPFWLVVVVLGYTGSLWLLSVVLDRGMAVGVAYGIWSAIGVVLTAALGTVLFGELLGPVQIVGVGVIVVGVLLVELGSHTRDTTEATS
ncbi:multidrug efflux SMR transporter [Microbacterium oxydans]|uniref:Multidrug transporter n=2 Tax=Microbacterium TaxID=33882 RepID=A0A147DX23_9MICO|nr:MULTISPECIES: multidrug efflux SMR transporter [Microbacterium]AZS41252.1 Multidrug transporter [Microbacterium oxydans]KAB1893809.1 multidrug efflux SMR transporter [Microbacterium oxydans]KKX96406.1 cation transporter [Microbacterium sp. Ag1]KTR74988.1 cation transporter [Microbacterium oxydans]MBE7953866.1 multidrug efflux SMR transporter [Microbacterium sp. R1]